MTSEDFTGLLHAWGSGDREASERLFTLLSRDLRRMARAHLARERRDHTFQPTDLVHEVYLKIAGADQLDWQNRQQFFGACGRIMRRLLVDHARRHRAEKRGGGEADLPLDQVAESLGVPGGTAEDLLALDQALRRLDEVQPRACRVVELRYFLGLSIAETARALGIAERTVKQDWTQSRARLFRALRGSV